RHTRSKRDWSSDVCSSDLQTAKRIFNVRGHIVRDIVLCGAWVIRDKARHHQIAATGLFNTDPLLLNLLRQQRRGELEFVLHLHRSEERRVGKGWRSGRAGG